jgi:glycogen debranching enzyme
MVGPLLQPREEDETSQYYIPATRTLHDGRLRTLKAGDSFVLLDRHGDIVPTRDGVLGLYHRDTRHLDRFELTIDSWRPLLLSSTIQTGLAFLAVDMTNPDIRAAGHLVLAKDTIHILRSVLIDEGGFRQRLQFRSFSEHPHRFRLVIRFGVDFADLFEIRGAERPRRGTLSNFVESDRRVRFAYDGLDGVKRQTVISFDPAPEKLGATQAEFEVVLGAHARADLFAEAAFSRGEDATTVRHRFLTDLRRQRRAQAGAMRKARIDTDHAVLGEVLERATADLSMLITNTPHGPYPYAGVPWFSTAFGRDGIITAIQLLWLDPGLALGVLRYLAATQARREDPVADAEPGKILHETRACEMANLGEVPFGMYYGSVDATPLFVVLAGLYFQRTGDLATISALWPNIEAALEWLDRFGDLDGDGFIEYSARTPRGLVNQGWKDSVDSVFHAEGRLAEGPIALVEVQAYAYAARRHAAALARRLGLAPTAALLENRAEALRQRFEEQFWIEELGLYALALDGEKRPCRVRSSNAGHALFGGIASLERAEIVARTLLQREAYSGWGIRTIAEGERRYNPMSYHNGSVWPHDNALIALGFAQYGLTDAAAQVFAGLFEAARRFEFRRLPELFCGFVRRPRGAPTAYPVACAPQSWSSAAPFGLLQACLGLSFDPEPFEIRMRRPTLPDFLQGLAVRALSVGGSAIDLQVDRAGTGVGVHTAPGLGRVPVAVTL